MINYRKVKKYFSNYGKVDESKLNTVDDIYVASMCRIAAILALFVSIFEVVLLTRLIIIRSSEILVSPVVTTYFFSYLVLFVASIVCLYLDLIWIKDFPKNKRKLYIMIYSFIGFILLWGFIISYEDIKGNQVFPAFVFITIVMGIFTGVVGKPKIVGPVLAGLYVASNLLFAYAANGSLFNFGYFMNSTVFFLIVGVISTYGFQSKIREWTLRLEMKEANQRLAELAQTDSLTSLKNLMNVEAELARVSNECIINGFKILCIQIDLDEFKYFNDRFGHLVGDRILVEAAKIVKNTSDVSYRLGGDKFFLAIPCMTYDSAYNVIQSLQEGFSQIKLMEAEYREVTASIGGYFGEPNKEFSEILKLTDDAVYYVKARGRNDFYLINS